MWRTVIPLVLCVAFGPSVRAQDDAARVIEAARQALGYHPGGPVVRTVNASGSITRVALRGLETRSEFEMTAALPDRYVRTERLAAGAARVETRLGFNGARLIRISPAVSNRGSAAALRSEAARAATERGALLLAKQEFGLLALGTFARAFDVYPVSFSPAGRAASPDGTADVVSLQAEGVADARLFVDEATHLPLMIAWMAPDVRLSSLQTLAGAGTSAPPDAAQIEASVSALRNAAVEHRLYFADYRQVGDVKWPFRVRRSVGGDTTEQWDFDRVRINGRIDEGVFEEPR